MYLLHLSCIVNKVFGKKEGVSASHLLFFKKATSFTVKAVFWWETLVRSLLQNTEFNCPVMVAAQSFLAPITLTSSVNHPIPFLSLWALE